MFNRKQLNKMKITVTKEVINEIEVKFPLSFKESETMFSHCYNEYNSITIYANSGVIQRYGTKATLNNYNPSMDCSKEEVIEAFKKVIKMSYDEVLSPIVIDLNSNTPTEELENLNTILFGQDEG